VNSGPHPAAPPYLYPIAFPYRTAVPLTAIVSREMVAGDPPALGPRALCRLRALGWPRRRPAPGRPRAVSRPRVPAVGQLPQHPGPPLRAPGLPGTAGAWSRTPGTRCQTLITGRNSPPTSPSHPLMPRPRCRLPSPARMRHARLRRGRLCGASQVRSVSRVRCRRASGPPLAVRGRAAGPRTSLSTSMCVQCAEAAATTPRTRVTRAWLRWLGSATSRPVRLHATGPVRASSVRRRRAPVRSVQRPRVRASSVRPHRAPVRSVRPHRAPVRSVRPHRAPVRSVRPHRAPVRSIRPQRGPARPLARRALSGRERGHGRFSLRRRRWPQRPCPARARTRGHRFRAMMTR